MLSELINPPQEIVAHFEERLGRRVVLPCLASNGFNKTLNLRRDWTKLDPILSELLRKVSAVKHYWTMKHTWSCCNICIKMLTAS